MGEQLTIEISDGHYALLEALREELDEDVDAELAAIVESATHDSRREYLR